MPVYIVGYDLNPPHGDHHYDELFTALEEMGSGYWDCLDSVWLIMTEKTPSEIRDELKRHLKDDDRLLVVRCGEGAAWHGFNNSCRTWLEDNL